LFEIKNDSLTYQELGNVLIEMGFLHIEHNMNNHLLEVWNLLNQNN